MSRHAFAHFALVAGAGGALVALLVGGVLRAPVAAALLALVSLVDLVAVSRTLVQPKPSDWAAGTERFAAVDWLLAQHPDRSLHPRLARPVPPAQPRHDLRHRGRGRLRVVHHLALHQPALHHRQRAALSVPQAEAGSRGRRSQALRHAARRSVERALVHRHRRARAALDRALPPQAGRAAARGARADVGSAARRLGEPARLAARLRRAPRHRHRRRRRAGARARASRSAQRRHPRRGAVACPGTTIDRQRARAGAHHDAGAQARRRRERRADRGRARALRRAGTPAGASPSTARRRRCSAPTTRCAAWRCRPASTSSNSPSARARPSSASSYPPSASSASSASRRLVASVRRCYNSAHGAPLHLRRPDGSLVRAKAK